jgi:hypothetical protein
MADTIRYEMGLTHAEFFRTLPSALQDVAYRVDDRQVTVVIDRGRVIITLGPQRQRRIALLSMPYVAVTFEFEDLDQVAADRFMETFMRYYQRGGG